MKTRLLLVFGLLAFPLAACGGKATALPPPSASQEEFDQWFENTLEAWGLPASGGCTPPAGLATPTVCLICTPGYFLTAVPTIQTPVPPTLPPFTDTPPIPTAPFPTP